MDNYTFIKKDKNWQLHYSVYTYEDGHDLDIKLEDAATMLNLLAEGKDEVTVVFDKEPFEGAEEIELIQTCAPFLNGGLYLLRNHLGKEINYEIWLSEMTDAIFGEMPEKIYFRKSPWTD